MICPLVLASEAKMWTSCSLVIIRIVTSFVDVVIRRDWVGEGAWFEEKQVLIV